MKKQYLMLLVLVGVPLGAQEISSGFFPAPQSTELQILEWDTQVGESLSLTRHLGGGHVVARVAKGEPVQVLLTEGGGYLVKTKFGLTGWAKVEEGGTEGLENLKTRTLDVDGVAAYTLHYHAGVAKEIHKKHTDPKDHDVILHDLLVTPLQAGGATYTVRCDTGVPNDITYCGFLKNQSNDEPVYLWGDRFYIPANGYVYSDYHDRGASYYRRYRKWQWTGDNFREVEQPYHYIGADGVATDMLVLRTKADGGNPAGTVAKGSKVHVILADPHQPCPSEFTLAEGAICDSATVLIRDEKGQSGWVTIRYEDGSSNPPPTIESDAMGGLVG